ncbi:MAG: DUF4272 domain-containing protein [Armatimonadetes bacterium]|nr:DUF4272 domain-containing protein [Armatimonadota bacterium]
MGFQVNPRLPAIESDGEVRIRSNEELYKRMIALFLVTGSAHYPDGPFFREYVDEHGIVDWLSKREQEFFYNDSRKEKDIVNFTWGTEAFILLSWCGGLIDTLNFPQRQSSIGPIADLLPQEIEEEGELKSALRVRSTTELLNVSDFLYRLHWALRSSPKKGQAFADWEIVMEWHKAINWITCYDDEDDWDQVSTDT